MAKVEILIRRFKEEDLPEALRLCAEVREYHREVLGGYFREIDEDFERDAFLESLDGERVLAFCAVTSDDAIAGILLAERKFQPYLEEPDTVYVSSLGVFKEYQGNGVGKALMDALYQYCQYNGIKEIKLGVFNKNVSAYKFYENLGFKPLEQKMQLWVEERKNG